MLVVSGIFAFVVCRGGSLAAIVGRDYARELDGITARWKNVFHGDDTVLATGEPLGSQFATFPHTFKRRCEDMVMSLSEENGSDVGHRILQQIAMALVLRGIFKFE